MTLMLPAVLILLNVLVALLFWWLFKKRTGDLEQRNKRLSALRRLDEIMMSSSTDLFEVAQKVTDAIATELGFEIGVLALIDEQKGVLRRVAMSNTRSGLAAKKTLPLPYEKLEIPLSYQQNLSVQVIMTNRKAITHNLYDLFIPTLDRATSKKIQQTVGVKTSLIYPVRARARVIGVMIVSVARGESELSVYERDSIENLVDVVGIALDNAMLYQNLKLTTKQLEGANVRLKELDRLKDDFVSVTSHELRTPMTAIRSYVWMALNRSDIPLTEKLKKYLQRILISTERLINLVSDMLNISRIEAGRVEITPIVFDMISLVGDVVDEVAPKAAEKGLDITVEKATIPQVFADEGKVHEVLLNLLGNSLKFTPSGGKITISFFSDGRVVETSVKDSGSGIAREDLGRLFQKFGRLDDSYVAISTSSGTGLGLYICKSLIELMYGRISAFSEGLGKGATFTFSLPVASQKVVEQSEKYHIRPKGEAKELEPVAI